MFTGEMAESKLKEITIKEVDVTTLRSLIDYVYTATIDITEDNVQSLLPAASVLQLNDVRQACSNYLQQQLDVDNCLGIKVFAEMHSCNKLESAASVYSSHHFSEVSKRESL